MVNTPRQQGTLLIVKLRKSVWISAEMRSIQISIGLMAIFLGLAPWGAYAGPALTLYDQAGLGGTSATLTNTYTIFSSNSIPAGLNDATSSFRLEQGYMVIVADQPNGLQPSRTYIASEGPLVVSTLPAELDNKISFIRIVPWKNTPKKGLCEKNDGIVQLVDPDWYYNWAASVALGQSVTNREFVPMSWGHTGSYPAAITNYLAMTQATHLLSFNEPDYPDAQSGQWGNLYIVSTAVVYHTELQKAGLRLGSPATCEENAGRTNGWLTYFMQEAEAADIRVDYVAVHWYDWGNNPAVNTNPTPESVLSRLKSYLSNCYHLYHKPIWITEFCANDYRPREIHDDFLKIAMPYLDSVGYVERYAYYATGGGSTTNYYFVDGSSNLTTTGYIYRDHVSTPAYVPKDLPAPWQTADVGAVAKTGDVIHANGTFTVCGTGAGITGTADEFRYVYQPLSGNITIVAKVNSMIWRHNDTTAGVMIREDLTDGSKNALMSLTSSNGAKFRRRTTAGGATTITTQAGITAPYWVKLARSNDTLTGYYSTNGVAWTQSGSQVIAMSNTVYAGLAVSAYNDGSFNDAIFTDVAVAVITNSPATVALGNLSQTYSGAARVVTAVTDPPGLAVALTYNGISAAPTNAGTYAVTGTVVEATYEGWTNVMLAVAKATPVVTNWPTASSISAGQMLSTSLLSGGGATGLGSPLLGNFIFDSPSTVPSAGVCTAAVSFVAADEVNFNSVGGGTVAVAVSDPPPGYSMQIAFTNFVGRGTLTNFPVMVRLTTSNTVDYTGFINTINGWDLRFWTNATLSGTELSYEIESFNSSSNSCVWVKVPQISQNSSIWASWGNPAYNNQAAYTTNGDVWTQGYRGVWHLNEPVADEAVGGVHGDSTSYGNHGAQYSNAPAAGVCGGAQSFDGNGDYIDFGTNASLAQFSRLSHG